MVNIAPKGQFQNTHSYSFEVFLSLVIEFYESSVDTLRNKNWLFDGQLKLFILAIFDDSFQTVCLYEKIKYTLYCDSFKFEI